MSLSTLVTGTSTCPDHHKCHNGGVCVPRDTDEGVYDCDCSGIPGDRVFTGLSCEHEATTFCSDDRTSFCANDGTCKVVNDRQGMHAGCECAEGYTGDYCEFVADQAQPEAYTDGILASPPSRGSSGSGNAAVIFGSIGAVAGVLAMLAIAVVYIRRRRNSQPHAADTKADPSTFDLDTDGGVMPDAPPPVEVKSPSFLRSFRRNQEEPVEDDGEGVEEGDML